MNTYTKEGKTYKNIDGEWVEIPDSPNRWAVGDEIYDYELWGAGGLNVKILSIEPNYYRNEVKITYTLDGTESVVYGDASIIKIESEKKEEPGHTTTGGNIKFTHVCIGYNCPSCFATNKYTATQIKLIEERCTKCNGDKDVWAGGGTYQMKCSHCNGSGKEPRKEETSESPKKWRRMLLERLAESTLNMGLCDCCGNDFHDCSCETTQWEINELEDKLSRYKEALEKIVKIGRQPMTSPGEPFPWAIEVFDTARTALAEEEKGRLV